MKIQFAALTDLEAWMALAREVEHVFGPMAGDASCQKALRQAISDKTAFCIRSEMNGKDRILMGGIVISKESNAIAWFAVSDRCRRKGYGRELLKVAISHLNQQKDIFVQTFDESVLEGEAARKLYFDFGFTDYKKGESNPAGVPTVIMQLANP